VLGSSGSTTDQVTAAIQALRDAKAKVQAQLTQAQADLKSVVTQHQEGTLVLMNILN
jgi:hypothetical protein